MSNGGRLQTAAVVLLICAVVGLALLAGLQREATTSAQHIEGLGPGVVGVFTAQWQYVGGTPTTTTLGIVYGNGGVEYRRLVWPRPK